jgi:hypothetical protein
LTGGQYPRRPSTNQPQPTSGAENGAGSWPQRTPLAAERQDVGASIRQSRPRCELSYEDAHSCSAERPRILRAGSRPDISCQRVKRACWRGPTSSIRAQRDSSQITVSAMGQPRLNMTLDEARRALMPASFARASDATGAALFEVTFGKGDSLTLWADEDDPAAPIDWSKRIVTIETFSAAFHTREGVHPGSLVNDVMTSFGPVREIVKSEIESRQYITFTRQPKAFTFRLNDRGIFPSTACSGAWKGSSRSH